MCLLGGLVMLLGILHGSLSTSFFGNSVIHVPYPDHITLSTRSSHLKLQFKTGLQNGLLFLAAGNIDYCIVEMHDGIVRVRIELGSGEAMLSSPPGLRLDDLAWHDLLLRRTNTDIKLTVDFIYETSTYSKGDFGSLNIPYGFYLGGIGTSLGVRGYSWDVKPYRGCLRHVSYNSFEVLHAAKQSKDSKNTKNIKWHCTDDFGLKTDIPISVVGRSGYLKFPAITLMENGATFSCNFKTRSKSGVLLYNPGRMFSKEFVAVEIDNGYAKFLVNTGDGLSQLSSSREVNDGKQHNIEISISRKFMRLTIDGAKMVHRFYIQSSLRLTGSLFIGGIGPDVYEKAQRHGVESVTTQGAALRGCIENIRIHYKPVGWKEALVTHESEPKCQYYFPCASSPCVQGSQCVELGKNYRCECDGDCVQATTMLQVPPTVLQDSDIIVVQTLKLREGGAQRITSHIIDFVYDYRAHRIRDSGIFFKVSTPPNHGRLSINVRRRPGNDLFTLLDLNTGKVQYNHNGDEDTSDQIGFEISLLGTHSGLPKQLQDVFQFTLDISVIPVNDPPKISLIPGGIVKLINGEKSVITSEVFQTEDPDTTPNKLTYVIKPTRQNQKGRFENENGGRFDNFTQQNIDDKKVFFHNRGSEECSFSVQVSDGQALSDMIHVKFKTMPIELDVVSNTGLAVFPGVGTLITPSNLTVSSKVPTSNLEVRYEITEGPDRGVLERFKSSNKQWIKVNSFTQRHLEKGKLRYRFTEQEARYSGDTFQFVATAKGARKGPIIFHIFRIRVKVNLVNNTNLVLDGIQENELSSVHLGAVTNCASYTPHNITFVLISTPRYGHLFKLKQTSGNKHKVRLGLGANFTQQDINSGYILFKMHRHTDEEVKDDFLFRIFAPGYRSKAITFTVQYIPEKSDVKFTNKRLKNVLEGGRKLITKDHLYIETLTQSQFRYTVTRYPLHGVLQLINPGTDRILQDNVTSFTNQDLRRRALVYKHDDSESHKDSFDFVAMPVVNLDGKTENKEMEIMEFSQTFEIVIFLRNDNPPERVIDQVLNVVTNQGRVITENDILYKDPDINFNSDDLLYTRRGIPNGRIVSTVNQSENVYKFTQADIKAKHIMFIHSGASYGRTLLLISDGQYYANGLLEIKASDPYIKIVNNTGLTLLKGGRVALTTANLSIETNINTAKHKAHFILIASPKHGKLLKRNHISSEFYLSEIVKNEVQYKHDGSANLGDSLTFAVRIGDTQIQDEMRIKIILESHQHPPKIIHNRVLVVKETGTVQLTSSQLQVSHDVSTAEQIVFTVTTPPEFGDLESITGTKLTSFSQDDINNERIRYIQTSPGAVSDIFMFEVTNGILTLKAIEFAIDIIPTTVPLKIGNLTVKEDGRKAVSENILSVTNPYLKDEEYEYMITRQPQYGHLELASAAGVRLDEFSSADVKHGFIYYIHGGEESTNDSFVILAKGTSSGQQSLPVTVHVKVIPVNDQKPVIVTNSELEVWSNSITPVTRDHLTVTDADSSPRFLFYEITTPSNGHLALKERPAQEIVRFTQDMVDRNQVVFVHKGPEKGSFEFQVNDGTNFTPRQTFYISATMLVLNLTTNYELEVYPETMQPIDIEHLSAETNGHNQTVPIVFTVTIKPKLGKIVTVLNNNKLEVTSFTIEELKKGLIAYEHTSSMSGWSLQDAFTFDVSTKYAVAITNRVFKISISYDNINDENKNQLISMSAVEVTEGGKVTLTPQHLDVSGLVKKMSKIGRSIIVKFTIAKLPKHGLIFIDEQNAKVGSYFLENDIKYGKFVYQNDHSDALWDSFDFNVQVSGRGAPTVNPKISNTFNITVIPVNDQPFKLLTKHPGIDVIQGFSVNITGNHLKTVDPDSLPENLTYTVLVPPTNGKLKLVNQPDLPVKRFTQKDLDQSKVIFIQDGTRHSGTFNFRVSDGLFTPFYKVFTINVIPVTLELVKNTAANLLQSHSVVNINTSHINIKTNGRRNDVKYNVTMDPRYGKLFIGDSEVKSFFQHHLDKSELSYIQTDMSASKDVIGLSINIMDETIETNFTVQIIPLVKQHAFDIPAGSSFILTLAELDASSLAVATNSNPQYAITEPPRYGILVRTNRKRDIGQKKNSTTHFTHLDIVNKRIRYEVDSVHIPENTSIKDGFRYILSAKNVQPAPGEFTFTLQPSRDPVIITSRATHKPVVTTVSTRNLTNATLDVLPVPAHGTNGTDSNYSSSEEMPLNISKDMLLIILLVAGILFILIIVIILVTCKIKQDRKKKFTPPKTVVSNGQTEPVKDVLPTISEEPPDLDPGINVRSPPRSPDVTRTEISKTTPCVKVTPLVDPCEPPRPKTPVGSIRSITSNGTSIDWDLVDPDLLQHCAEKTPVLRRTQYWV